MSVLQSSRLALEDWHEGCWETLPMMFPDLG